MYTLRIFEEVWIHYSTLLAQEKVALSATAWDYIRIMLKDSLSSITLVCSWDLLYLYHLYMFKRKPPLRYNFWFCWSSCRNNEKCRIWSRSVVWMRNFWFQCKLQFTHSHKVEPKNWGTTQKRVVHSIIKEKKRIFWQSNSNFWIDAKLITHIRSWRTKWVYLFIFLAVSVYFRNV